MKIQRTKPRKVPLPCKKKIKEYDADKEQCQECPRREACIGKTVERLMAVNNDLNEKLALNAIALDDSGMLVLGLDDSGWQLVRSSQYEEAAKGIKDWQEGIREVLDEWLDRTPCHEISSGYNNLHPATIAYLNETWPGWESGMRGYLDNTHVLDDSDPDRLKLFLGMPYYVIDTMMNKMSGSAWKVFTYLSRRATFDPAHRNFGRCWVKYDEVTEYTGVKTVERYVKELEELDAIEVNYQRRNFNGAVVTKNQFTIVWMKKLQELKNR